jgi:hypothetical protein
VSEQPTCKTCPFFNDTGRNGECRKNPPQGAMVQGHMGQPGFLGFYPPTQAHHWCGAHPQMRDRTSIIEAGSLS